MHHLLGSLSLLQELIVVLALLTLEICLGNRALSLDVLLRGCRIGGELLSDVIEVLILDHLANCDPFGALNCEHFFHERNGLGGGSWNDLKKVPWRVIMEVDVDDSCESVALDPGFVGCSQNLENLIELVEFVVSLKERLFSVKLGHDASKGKDVDWTVIAVTLEENLRGSVPASGHIVCIGRLGSNLSYQSKVCQFDLFLII